MAVRAGLAGCGNVSTKYLNTILGSSCLKVVACADLDPKKATDLESKYNIHASKSLHDLILNQDLDLVLNLTAPDSHAQVSMEAIANGKHVYTEKPLATSVEDGRAIVEAARKAGVLVGCAPDTFLGRGLQTTSGLLRQGAIGEPLSAISVLSTTGPEHFHPTPEFLYDERAGPLFDIGPYLVTALTFLLGKVRAVTAVTATPVRTRTFRVGDRIGQNFTANVPTFISSVLEFESGVLATLVQGWDVVGTTAPRLEIHGTDGSIVAPSPDSWDGPVRLLKKEGKDFLEVGEPSPTGTPSNLGIGALQMAEVIENGGKLLASGEQGLHTLEVLHAILRSGETGCRVDLDTSNQI